MVMAIIFRGKLTECSEIGIEDFIQVYCKREQRLNSSPLKQIVQGFLNAEMS